MKLAPELVVPFIGTMIGAGVAYYVGAKALRATRVQQQKQAKGRMINIYMSISEERGPTDKERAGLVHEFYEYSGYYASDQCLMHIISKKDRPQDIGHLAKVSPWVIYDEEGDRIVRAKGKDWVDDVARIFAFMFFTGIPASYLIYQESFIMELAKIYANNPTTQNLSMLAFVYVASFLLVIFSLILFSSANEHFISINALTQRKRNIHSKVVGKICSWARNLFSTQLNSIKGRPKR